MATKKEMLKHEQWIRQIVRDKTKTLIEQEVRKQLQKQAADTAKQMRETYRALNIDNQPSKSNPRLLK